jgi:hypothetical protein
VPPAAAASLSAEEVEITALRERLAALDVSMARGDEDADAEDEVADDGTAISVAEAHAVVTARLKELEHAQTGAGCAT